MTSPDVAILDCFPKTIAGEGIIWDSRQHCLWWVDIRAQKLFRAEPDKGHCSIWDMPEAIGCLALTEPNGVVVALTSGLFALDTKTGQLQHLASLPGEAPDHRPNDGAVSRSGRLFLGTTALGNRSKPSGKLYSFDGRETRCVLSGLHVANGMAFSPDDRTAYLSDSWPDVQSIWAFDHDPDTGDLSNRRVFFDTRQTAGRPDGACIDTDGCYWMAGVGGGEVLRITPDGRVDQRLPVPVLRPSKPCFGGPDLSTLYVTSIGLDADKNAPDGRIVQIDLPYQGLKEPRISINR